MLSEQLKLGDGGEEGKGQDGAELFKIEKASNFGESTRKQLYLVIGEAYMMMRCYDKFFF